jgi:WD40 repeat protein
VIRSPVGRAKCHLFSNDEQLLAYASDNPFGGVTVIITLFKVEAMEIYYSLEFDNKYDGDIYETYLAFSSDSRRIACTVKARTMICASWLSFEVWDIQSRKVLMLETRLGEDAEILQALFTPDGQKLCIAVKSGEVQIWNIGNGILEGEFNFDNLLTIAFMANGKYMLVGTKGAIEILDITTENTVLSLKWQLKLYNLDLEHVIGPLWYHMEFSATDESQLISSIGAFKMELSSSQTKITVKPISYHLDEAKSWIMWNSNRIIWLPTRYRPWMSYFRNNTFLLSTTSDLVHILRFKSNINPITGDSLHEDTVTGQFL